MTRDPVSVAILLERTAGGDRLAFRQLYDTQVRRLYGIALRITRQPALAADAVQDALLQVWQRAAMFDPARGSAEAWLTNLVRYRAIDAMRARRREAVSDEAVPEHADESPDALDRLMLDSAGQALHRCISELDPNTRRVIVLAFVEGLSHSELSERLGSPLGTVKSWIRRGLLSLKACLEPADERA